MIIWFRFYIILYFSCITSIVFNRSVFFLYSTVFNNQPSNAPSTGMCQELQYQGYLWVKHSWALGRPSLHNNYNSTWHLYKEKKKKEHVFGLHFSNMKVQHASKAYSPCIFKHGNNYSECSLGTPTISLHRQWKGGLNCETYRFKPCPTAVNKLTKNEIRKTWYCYKEKWMVRLHGPPFLLCTF